MEIKDLLKLTKNESVGQFLKILEISFKKAVEGNHKILIDLDEIFLYPSSFVSNSFGSLSIKYGSELVLKHLEFKSLKFPIRKDKTIFEINIS